MSKVNIRYVGQHDNAKNYDCPKYLWKKGKVKKEFPKDIAIKLCKALPQDFEIVEKNKLTKKWEKVV